MSNVPPEGRLQRPPLNSPGVGRGRGLGETGFGFDRNFQCTGRVLCTGICRNQSILY